MSRVPELGSEVGKRSDLSQRVNAVCIVKKNKMLIILSMPHL